MKIELGTDGAVISTEHEGNKNEDGTHAVAQWNVNADQLAKHLRGIEDTSHPWNKCSKGDKSAAADAANENKKQRGS